MRTPDTGELTGSGLHTRSVSPGARTLASGTWRHWRDAGGGRPRVGLELLAPDGVRGQAWGPDLTGLRDALDRALEPRDAAVVRVPDAGSRVQQIAQGLVACAKLAVTSRRHEVALHVWLGGAMRRRVSSALPVVFHANDRAARDSEVAGAVARFREAWRVIGPTSVAVHDGTTDVALISHTIAAIRQAIGPSPAIVARLAGQLTPAATGALLAGIRDENVVCVTDPCATLPECLDATRDALPALGLSAARYPREALLACLAASPPAVLFVDPLVEGGPMAVRELAGTARVLQVDLSLIAENGGLWLVQLCTELAAVLPAAHQPVSLPLDWTVSSLEPLGIRDGALPLAAGAPALSPACEAPPAINGALTPGLHP